MTERFLDLDMHLASAAAHLVELERENQVPRRGTMLASLFSADNYYRDAGEVYPCGAYITIYLIQKYGFDKFLQLYMSVHPQSASRDVERIFDTDLVTLEKQMWQEADKLAIFAHHRSRKFAFRRCRPNHTKHVCPIVRTSLFALLPGRTERGEQRLKSREL